MICGRVWLGEGLAAMVDANGKFSGGALGVVELVVSVRGCKGEELGFGVLPRCVDGGAMEWQGGLSDGRRSNGESSLGDSLVLVQWRWGKVDGVEVDEWVILMDGELPSSLTCAPGGSIRVLIDLLSDH
ncbi:hypothetical protein V6N11_058499 [Hibiscus sabdariffa]|uniref:Uncharacterized protein n=1 Tax=Hibiscus sabdariffa TaxID=183260 RepID=A0ABR2U502_9ROSI